MELWVRSQDKEKLLKVDEIHLGLDKEYKLNVIWVNNWIVGEYKSKERALEVLDEIQSRLDAFVNNDYLKNVTDVSKQVYIAPFIVYEMPSEWV